MNRNLKTKQSSVYRRARKSGNPFFKLWKKYTSLRNEVVTILRKSKREHLRKVSRQGVNSFGRKSNF